MESGKKTTKLITCGGGDGGEVGLEGSPWEILLYLNFVFFYNPITFSRVWTEM